MKPETRNSKLETPFLVLLTLVLLAGGWLRWQFIQTVHLYPDEFVTLLAMDMIRQKGVPVLPSGLFYDHGLLYSYLAAGASLLGNAALWGRLTSLLFGLATIVLTYFVGKRWFSPATGLLAATGIAFAPSAIQWSGRVRMYAMLQFLVLLAVWLLGEDTLRRNIRAAWLAVGVYFAALLTQFVAVALLPSLVLAEVGVLWRQKRRRVTDWQVWLWLMAVAGAVLVAFLVKRAGQPKGIAPLQQTNPIDGIWQVVQIYTHLSLDVAGSWRTLAPFFTQPPALAFSLFALVAIGFQVSGFSSQRLAVGFLAGILVVTTGVMLFLVAPDRRDDKYLFMLLPALLLLGARGMTLGGHWLSAAWRRHIGVQVAALALAVLALGGYSHNQVADLLADSGEDYATAFTYVANHWQPGDVVLTGTPAAAHYYLGENDYYAVQAGGVYDYRILTRPDGRQVERWLGSPWIHTLDELNAVLSSQSVWLVLERWGLLVQYYRPLFMQNILAQTKFVREDNGVIVLKSLPNARRLRPDPVVPAAALLVGTAGDPGQLKLLGYTLEGNRLTLYWQAQQPVIFDYTVFVNVQTVAGKPVTQVDHRPLGSVYPTTLWPVGEIIRETSTLDLSPGTYRLRVGMYRLETGERLWVPSDTTMQNMVELGEITVNNEE